ncbi:MAG: hypothetical protein AAGB31_06755, partial [Bdellovibrio sp.]
MVQKFLKWFVFGILLVLSSVGWTQGQVFLNTEDGQVVSVFSKPGMTWETCEGDSNCNAVGWPDNTATILALSDNKKIRVKDPHSGKTTEESYTYILFQYERKLASGASISQKGEGWIDSAYLSKSKVKSFFGNQIGASETCSDSSPQSAEKKAQKRAEELLQTNTNSSISNIAEQLEGVVGACVI